MFCVTEKDLLPLLYIVSVYPNDIALVLFGEDTGIGEEGKGRTIVGQQISPCSIQFG